jgi:hypothetical protein
MITPESARYFNRDRELLLKTLMGSPLEFKKYLTHHCRATSNDRLLRKVNAGLPWREKKVQSMSVGQA